MKRWLSILLAMVVVFSGLSAFAETIFDTESGETAAELTAALPAEKPYVSVEPPKADAKAYLLMELSTGEVLFAENEHDQLPIASVTKIMTMLLVIEGIEEGRIQLTDEVTCSAHAASMGGSQIWLKEGERMTVHELIKAAAVVSANDACAALAEHLCGSTETFTAAMNERANELGMQDTVFLDCSGLDDNARSSAYDVALMSRELMKHEMIKQYTTIWMDTLRDGKSELVNTNKLVRFYPYATGLKTGTTSGAGHCLSATAARDGMSFAAVILGGTSAKGRFSDARKMLDYGFANFALFSPYIDLGDQATVRVTGGESSLATVAPQPTSPVLLARGDEKKVTVSVSLKDNYPAPLKAGQEIGKAEFFLDGEIIASVPLAVTDTVRRRTWVYCLSRLWCSM